MRGQMENRADYVAPLAIGDVMRAGGVGVIEASKNREPAGRRVGRRLARHAGLQRHGRQVAAGARLPGRHRSHRCARRTRRHRHDGVLRSARPRRAETGTDRGRQRCSGRNGQRGRTDRAHQRLPRGRPRGRRREVCVAHRRTRLRRGDRLQVAKTSAARSTPRARTASTSISTTSAARSSTSVSRASR